MVSSNSRLGVVARSTCTDRAAEFVPRRVHLVGGTFRIDCGSGFQISRQGREAVRSKAKTVTSRYDAQVQFSVHAIRLLRPGGASDPVRVENPPAKRHLRHEHEVG